MSLPRAPIAIRMPITRNGRLLTPIVSSIGLMVSKKLGDQRLANHANLRIGFDIIPREKTARFQLPVADDQVARPHALHLLSLPIFVSINDLPRRSDNRRTRQHRGAHFANLIGVASGQGRCPRLPIATASTLTGQYQNDIGSERFKFTADQLGGPLADRDDGRDRGNADHQPSAV